jgi:spore germination protein GerM
VAAERVVRTHKRLIILVGALLIAMALGVRTWLERHPDELPPPLTGVDSTSAGMRAVPLWFASADAESLVIEPREMPERIGLHERVAALITALEQGPRAGGIRALPEGTALLNVYLDDAGLLTLDLSRAFRQGFKGGARAEELALGSLIRTVASGVPEAKRIRIVCAGNPLPTLGGHFPLDQPIDPNDWP